MFGVNIDSIPSVTEAEFIRTFGMDRVRLVIDDFSDFNKWQQFSDAGILLCVVYANQSRNRSVEEAWNIIKDMNSIFAMGNEEDAAQDSESSWWMDANEYNEWLESAAMIVPKERLMIGSAVSGQPSYFDNVDITLASMIGINPYGQRPLPIIPRSNWGYGYVRELVWNYIAYFESRSYSMRLSITELGIRVDDRSNHWANEVQSYWLYMMGKTLQDLPYMEGIYQFCLSDSMVQGFGLFDSNGNPFDGWEGWQSVVR